MTTLEEQLTQKAGLPPGTLIHIGERKTEQVFLKLCEYNESTFSLFEEKEMINLQEYQKNAKKNLITWLNIDGLHDTNLIKQVGDLFEIHSLVLEDIVNTKQRPKVEDYDNFIYVVIKAYSFDNKKKKAAPEHISLILGKDFVLSFQEKPEDAFKPILKRIANANGRIRKMKADYLLYALLDSIVDHYFILIEKLNERIEKLQDKLISNPDKKLLGRIHTTRKNILSILKRVSPIREVLSRLPKLDFSELSDGVQIYFRDVQDHIFQVIDSLEAQRDSLAAMIEMYNSTMSQKMNEVMKVLTIIATIFMPLTFIVGVYGMNFKFMPELEWKWGYPFIWGILVGIGMSLFFFFKRKKWF